MHNRQHTFKSNFFFGVDCVVQNCYLQNVADEQIAEPWEWETFENEKVCEVTFNHKHCIVKSFFL